MNYFLIHVSSGSNRYMISFLIIARTLYPCNIAASKQGKTKQSPVTFPPFSYIEYPFLATVVDQGKGSRFIMLFHP